MDAAFYAINCWLRHITCELNRFIFQHLNVKRMETRTRTTENTIVETQKKYFDLNVRLGRVYTHGECVRVCVNGFGVCICFRSKTEFVNTFFSSKYVR